MNRMSKEGQLANGRVGTKAQIFCYPQALFSFFFFLFFANELPPPLRNSVVGRAGGRQDRGWTRQTVDGTSGRQTGTNKAADRAGRWWPGTFLCGLLMRLQRCVVVWRRPGSWCRGARIWEDVSSELTWPFTSIFSKPLFMCQAVTPRGQGPGVLSLTGCFFCSCLWRCSGRGVLALLLCI